MNPHDPATPPAHAWLALPSDPASPVDIDSIASTVELVLSICSDGSFDRLDFSLVDPRRCSVEHLAAALRASSFFCDHIPSWRLGLQSARLACSFYGSDPDDALFGMN